MAKKQPQAQDPKPTGIVNKIVDAVDHVLHPGAAQPDAGKAEAVKSEPKKVVAKKQDEPKQADPILGKVAESYDVKKVNDLSGHISRERF